MGKCISVFVDTVSPWAREPVSPWIFYREFVTFEFFFTGPDFVCNCNAGYDGDGVTCTEINECIGVTVPANAQCVDLVGDYEITCLPGFIMLANGSCVTPSSELGQQQITSFAVLKPIYFCINYNKIDWKYFRLWAIKIMWNLTCIKGRNNYLLIILPLSEFQQLLW